MKVGIIGLGYRMGYLARIFSLMVPGFTVVGYVDPAPAGLGYMKEHGIEAGRAYGSPSALLTAEKLDLLMVGSPNAMHLDHIRAGLEHGIKVFAEKPVVTSQEDTFKLLELLRIHGTDSVMVGLVLRYASLYRDLTRMRDEGVLGDIVSIEASEHLAPYHGAFFMRDWRRYQHYSGGFMLEKCCHDIDLYQGLVGSRPVRVASFGGRRTFLPGNAPTADGINDMEIYHRKPSGWLSTDKVFDSDADIIDFQVAIVEFENGVALNFHTNINVPDEFRRFCVIGSKGMAEGDFVRNYFRVHDARTSQKLIDKTYEMTALSAHYGADEQMAADIGKHLIDGAPLPVSVVDALAAGLTAIKMDEARASRAVLDLNDSWRRFDEALTGE
ncbi:Gfo/Idh/MocA family oxidoreductase [Labrys sp. ZIDIC5]|uniref:Gfo/Idh/MocA family protein n=1 Tax=Labrys sedimenti TaxID=3106036 RepID=UPI002ACA8A61|nr:Gfo/Idh/MocA family oxidoreductase [Labrys sp. ZIDIC5]MDZ5452634.1 Gfo/Idh/MocA family oxidoreductase [Labrys sp. ZIDIC5]